MSLVNRPGKHSKWFLPGIIQGMILTLRFFLKNLFSRHEMLTINYPEEKHKYSPRFRGNHVLTVRKNNEIRCTACMLCVTACPANCIKIEAAEHLNTQIEKFPIKYEIDMLRCIYCGFCEEACPVDAIRMGPEWQIPGLGDEKFIYNEKKLAFRPTLKGGILSHVDDQERFEAGL